MDKQPACFRLYLVPNDKYSQNKQNHMHLKQFKYYDNWMITRCHCLVQSGVLLWRKFVSGRDECYLAYGSDCELYNTRQDGLH